MLSFDTKKGADDVAKLEKIFEQYEPKEGTLGIIKRVVMGDKASDKIYDYAKLPDQNLEAELKRLGYGSYEEAKKKLTEDKEYLRQATELQKRYSLVQGAQTSADFKTASASGAVSSDNKIKGFRDNDNWKNWYNKELYESLRSENPYYYAAKHMTDDEYAVYSYYIGKGEKDKAEEYLKSLKGTINDREAGEIYKDVKGNWLKEMMFAPEAGFDQFISGMKGAFNLNGDIVTPTITQYTSSLIREDLKDTGPQVFGVSLGQGAYDLTTTNVNMFPSILASYATSFLTGNPALGRTVGNTLMGVSAAGNAYQQMVNAGYDVDQARAYGILTGISEAKLEALLGGISGLGGKLTNSVINKAIEGIDRAWLKAAIRFGMEMGSEGLEEGLQDILEPLFKNAIFGTDESIDWEQVAYSALLGALSAGAMNSVTGGVNTMIQSFENGYYKGAYGDKVAQIVDEALEINPENKLAQKMKAQIGSKQDVSGRNIRRLVQDVQTAQYEGDQNKIRQAVTQQLQERGERANIGRLADIITKSVSGEPLTMTERAELAASQYGQRVLQELSPVNIRGVLNGDTSGLEAFAAGREWTQNIGTKVIRPNMYNPARNAVQPTQIETPVLRQSGNEIADTLVQKANQGAVTAEDITHVLDNAEAVQALESTVGALELEGKTREEQAKAVQTAVNNYVGQYQENVRQAAQATQANRPVSESVENIAQKYGKQAGAVRSIYNMGNNQDVETFARDLENIIQIGRDGGTEETALGMENSLNDLQKLSAWMTGRAMRDAENIGTKKRANNPGTVRANGLSKEISKNKYLRKGVQVLRAISALTGLTIDLYDSSSANFQMEQGSYSKDTNVIRLDIRSGINTDAELKEFTKYAILRTFGHEVTHFGQDFNPAEYNILATTVLEALARNEDFDLESRIRAIQNNYAQYNIQKQIRQGKTRAEAEEYAESHRMTRSEAIDEIVADGMADVLPETEFFDRLIQKDMNVGQKLLNSLKQFISRIKERISEYFSGLANNLTPEANALKYEMNDQVKYLEGLAKQWENMLLGAVENYQNALKNVDERVSGKTEQALEDVGSVAIDGVVVAAPLAEDMVTKGFEKPVDPLEQYSVRTFDAWQDNYLKDGGDNNVAISLKSFTDAMIANDAIMGFVPTGDYKYNKFGPLRKNIEYIWTFDMDASCPRTFQFVNYRNALQARAGRPLTDAEAMNLMYLMRRMNQQIPCTYCYVENKRIAKSASYLNWFASRQAVMAEADENVARTKMYGYNEKTGELPAAAQKVFDAWRAEMQDGFAPSAEECWTGWNTAKNSIFNYLDEQLKNGDIIFGYKVKKSASTKALVNKVMDHFDVHGAEARREVEGMVSKWQYDTLAQVNHVYDIPNDTSVSEVDSRYLKLHRLATNYASSVSQARLLDDYIPYTDQLKNVSAADKAFIIGMGGVRKHSSNDFRIDYVQDYFLFYADLAKGKWTGHTYTKSIDFCKIFGRCNDRINLSIAMDTRNGKIVENQQEGAAWRDARDLRRTHNTIGVMAMVTDNAQLSFALNSDWIDMCIPFHASGLPKAMWYNLRAWFDYTTVQLESYFTTTEMKERLKASGVDTAGLTTEQIEALFNETYGIKVLRNAKGQRVKPHFFPEDTYVNGQLVPGHHNDAARYKELCEEFGVHPRFWGVQVTDKNGNVIDVTEHENYVKLIKETARTEEQQKPIEFNFDQYDEYLGMSPMDYAMQRMEEDAKIGGYKNTAADPFGIVPMFERLYLGKNRSVGWMPSESLRDTNDDVELLYTALEATQTAYNEMYDADTQVLEDYQKILTEGSADVFNRETVDATAQEIENNEYSEEAVVHSLRVTDQNTLNRLNEEFARGEYDPVTNPDGGYITVYRSYQMIDGGLYPPMNAVDRDENGRNKKLGFRSEPGVFEMATEAPEIARRYIENHPGAKYAKFDLDGIDNKTGGVDYAPYLHSSNMVLNDQFTAAYRRNLVVVECRVPVSEMNDAYHAEYAKNGTGWHDWKKGAVAGKLAKLKPEYSREVFLSRYMMPVRIVPDAEVAQMYKEYLSGTDLSIPWNVVTPSLRQALENEGVRIDYRDLKSGDSVIRYADVFHKEITPGMTDEERYEALKDRSITVNAKTDSAKIKAYSQANNTTIDPFPRLASAARKQLFHKIGEEFKVFKDYNNQDINLDFSYSSGNMKESLNKQAKNYSDFVKLLSCFDQVIDDAVGIEVHNRNDEGYKADKTLKNVYVLLSAFEDGERIVPVKLEVKEFSDKKNTLYVTITLDGIKKDEVNTQGGYPEGRYPQYARSSSTIMLSDLFSKINREDTNFLKYIPTQFLENNRPSEIKEVEQAVTSATSTTEDSIPQPNTKSQPPDENSVQSLRTQSYTDRELLQMAADNVSLQNNLTQSEKSALSIFNQRLEKLRQLEEQQAEQRRILEGLTDQDEITKTQNRINLLGRKISAAENLVLNTQNTQALKKVLRDAKRFAVSQVQRNERARLQERSDITKYRDSIQKKVKSLSDKLLKNSDKEHIPEALKGVLGDFLQSIDFSSRRLMNGGEPTKRDIKYADLLDRVRQALQKQTDYMNNPENGNELGGYLDLPPEFVDTIQEHINKVKEATNGYEGNGLFAMDSTELKNLDHILGVISHSVNQINEFHMKGRFANIPLAGQSTITDMNQRRKFEQTERAAGVRNMLAWKNMLPFYAFKKYGAAGQAIFNEIQRGWEKFAFNTRQVIDFAEKTYNEKEQKEWSNKVHTIDISDGRQIKITTAQIMSLYCLNKRQQARQHILGGGIRVGNIETKNGLKKQAITQTDNYTLTTDDVKAITSQLTDRQIEVANKLQEYMNTVGTRWGNEVSMARFGYEGFGEPNYFPIESDDTNLPARDPDAKANDLFRLINMSMTKALNPKANNALVVSDIFKVFANHMSDMAKYNSLVLPSLDAMKWINYKETQTNPNGQVETQTVKRAIERAYGKEGMSYFMNFMKDLNGNNNGGRDESGFFGKLMSAYKVAAVAANLRVGLLQPTSYAAASQVLSPAVMTKALTMDRKKAHEERMKYSGISVWKDLGFFDTNIGRNVEDLIMHNDTVRDKITERALWLAEKGDSVTWDVIWNACKLDQQNKGLKGDELIEATNNEFMDVIYQTQVVDSTLTRSQLMRDKSMFIKNITGFFSEPTIRLNQLVGAYNEFETDAQKMGKAAAWSKNKGKIITVMGAYVGSQLLAAIVESIADAARDDDDYESYLDKWLQAFLGDESFLDGNLYSDLSIAQKLPVIKDIISNLKGYESTNMTFQAFDDLINIKDVLTSKSRPAYGKIYKVAQMVSRFSGVPVSNAMREFSMIWNNTVGVITGNKLKTYERDPKKVIKEAYATGKLDKEQAIHELMKKEEMSEEDALKQVTKWQYSDWDSNGNGTLSQEEVAIGLESGNFTEKEKKKIWSDLGYNTDYGTKQQDKAKAQIKLDENAVTYDSSNWQDGMKDGSLPAGDKDALMQAYGSEYMKGAYKTLRTAGYSATATYEMLQTMDKDKNKSIKQEEAYNYLVNKSDAEALRIWNSFGWKTDWATYKARQH